MDAFLQIVDAIVFAIVHFLTVKSFNDILSLKIESTSHYVRSKIADGAHKDLNTTDGLIPLLHLQTGNIDAATQSAFDSVRVGVESFERSRDTLLQQFSGNNIMETRVTIH